MKNNQFTSSYLKELESEYTASKKCVERIPDNLYGFKPHPTSMEMRYLTLLVAEIPLWISLMFEQGEIDFATYKHIDPKSTKEMVDHLEKNYEAARKALKNATDEDLQKKFELKDHGKLLSSDLMIDSVPSTLNHWVHHRGQLTVYMRISGIEVPSIYGPSGDDKSFGS